jgi:hypothetical protein
LHQHCAVPSAQNKGLGGYPVRLSSINENNPPGKAKTAMTQFGGPPVLGSNEQIFGVKEQILGQDQSDQGAPYAA